MQKLLFVFLGSGIGGVLRYGISLAFNPTTSGKFPWATLLANCLAGLLVGIFFALSTSKSWFTSNHLLLLTIGLCGGLSTFSTFSLESLKLWQTQEYVMAITYTLSSVVACFIFVFIGTKIIQ